MTRRIRHSLVAVAAAAAVCLSLPSALGAPRSGVVYLPNVLPRLDLASLLGPAPAATPLNVVVVLARPNPAAEDAAYQAMYDPASPSYRHFLTPGEFNARFGVAPATVTKAQTWLKAGGLEVMQVAPTGDLIQVSGSAAAVGRLFRTPMKLFSYRGQRFVANTAAPTVPAGLPITTVVGLNTLQQFKTFAKPAAGGTFNGTFTERDLWKVYDLPNSNYGEGEPLAIFGDGNPDPVIANLRVFEQRQSLPQVPVRVVHTEAGDHSDVSNGLEWNLDTQASTGMAPMTSQLTMYFGNTLSDASVLAMFSAWSNDPKGPPQASASFGECEANPLNPLFGNPLLNPKIPWGNGLGDNVEAAGEPMLKQATMEGRTLFNSTGDTAGTCPAVALPILGPGNGILPGTAPFQSYPAVSKYVVAVGGTVVTSDASKSQRVDESSWTFTGGGPSAFMSEPAFQKRFGAVNSPCPVDPSGRPYASGTICRGIPDIAADSAGGLPGVGGVANFNVVEDMVDTGVGGTSLSSPLSLGMWTRIQAGAPRGGLGFADESLYRLAAGKQYHRDFYDVTSSEFGVGNLTNQPGPGWDYTSGLGVMDAAHLMDDLTGRRTPLVRVAPRLVPPNPLGGDCRPVFSSPAGNAKDAVTGQNDAGLDMSDGQFALSPDKKALVVTIVGPGLGGLLNPAYLGGTNYLVFWTYQGTTYYVEAQTFAPGLVVFSEGHVDHANGLVAGPAPDGTIQTGKITITVPLSAIGNPPIGALLQYPYGLVQGLVGAPGAITIFNLTVDAASSHDYRLGYHC